MFYCIESTFPVVQPSKNKKRTYKTYNNSQNLRDINIEYFLNNGANYVKVKKISESQYIKATRNE